MVDGCQDSHVLSRLLSVFTDYIKSDQFIVLNTMVRHKTNDVLKSCFDMLSMSAYCFSIRTCKLAEVMRQKAQPAHSLSVRYALGECIHTPKHHSLKQVGCIIIDSFANALRLQASLLLMCNDNFKIGKFQSKQSCHDENKSLTIKNMKLMVYGLSSMSYKRITFKVCMITVYSLEVSCTRHLNISYQVGRAYEVFHISGQLQTYLYNIHMKYIG